MNTSKDFSEKSISAAVSAIEIYNKPDFSYREEAFSLLMVNAWELLLKAKWLVDRNDDISTLYIVDIESPKGATYKLNRSGNPITHGAQFLSTKLLEDPDSGLDKPCHDNIHALIEIRDNSAHFINKDIYFGRRILEIGTASLRNYVQLGMEWFQLDLSRYNFFLMPISFYHGFEAIQPAVDALYPEQVIRLLKYLDNLQEEDSPIEEMSTQHVALRLETRLVKGNKAEAIEFKWTNDPTAPTIALREEDVTKNYPLTYRMLTDALRRRYSNFLENRQYHKLRNDVEKENKYCLVRLLNPKNPKSAKQRFYNPNIFQEFDMHYERRIKP